MSKGSSARPIEIPREQFRSNWDQIFGKKDQQKPQELQELNKQKGEK